jgi:hypothetical protein
VAKIRPRVRVTRYVVALTANETLEMDGGELTSRVQDTPDWKQQAADPEAEMLRRGWPIQSSGIFGAPLLLYGSLDLLTTGLFRASWPDLRGGVLILRNA